MFVPKQPMGYVALSRFRYGSKSAFEMATKELQQELCIQDTFPTNLLIIKWLIGLTPKQRREAQLFLKLREQYED